MGGLYHPTAKGIIDGQKIGLKNSTDIVHYIFDLEDVFENLKIPEPYTSPGIEYYIGFGNGYEKGQQLRKLLENNTDTRMSSDEKIECCEYLLHKDEICRIGMQKKYLQNIKHWDSITLPHDIAQISQKHLNEKKIQKAIDGIFNYYKDHFNLKALKEFDKIFQEFKNIRNKKKINMNYNSNEDLENIKNNVIAWIKVSVS